VSEIAALGRQVLRSYTVRTSQHDPRYWRGGSFVAANGPSCWSCYDTAATAAAVLSTTGTGDTRLQQLAIDTFSHAIHAYQTPSGEFTPDGVTTGFFAVELGISYLELRAVLPPTVRQLWRSSLTRAANWLIKTGQTTFYINGNVNLRQTEVLWLAWAASGNPRFRNAYQREWTFTISPPGPRWSAFGLKFTRRPTTPDGSDGAAYLAESGGGTPGYDPSYTMAQLDTATELYVLTRDPRYVRLMNLLFNQERPRIDAFTLNATGGTRKNDDIPFLSSAPGVLVLTGQRPTLRSFWLGQLRRIQREFRGATVFTAPDYYKGLSGWLMMPILALQWPKGLGLSGT